MSEGSMSATTVSVRPLNRMVHIRVGDSQFGTNTALEPTEALTVAQQIIAAAVKLACSRCRGSGEEDTELGLLTCPRCDGLGFYCDAQDDLYEALQAARPIVANAIHGTVSGPWQWETRQTILAQVDAAIAKARGELIPPKEDDE